MESTKRHEASDFGELGLSNWLVKQCKAVGFTRPTTTQRQCIPQILRGNNCIGCAQTGSGKTAAFALPILQKLSEEPYGIYCLVLTPTRELAFQLSEQFRALGKPIGLKDVIVVGGLDMVQQGIQLSQKPHVIIATPGRLADHLDSSDGVDLSKIRFLVMDEADRLLEASFVADMKKIFHVLPKKRQTLMFSATITNAMYEAQKLALEAPFIYEDENIKITATVDQLDQRYLLMPSEVKDCYLVYLIKQLCLEQENNKRWNLMLFTGTCRSCQTMAIILSRLGLSCAALHSLMPQRHRLASLARFKSGIAKILVATDVASRGLDIPTVEVIVNYNVPSCASDYIHRVGRTARAGKGGLAITLMTQYDVDRIHNIETVTKVKLCEYQLDEDDVLKLLNTVTLLRKEVDIRLEETNFGQKREINKRKIAFLSRSKAKRSKIKTVKERAKVKE